MASKLDFTKQTFALITGASQGIGRTIAIEISRRLNPSSKLLLFARSEKGLLETKKLIMEVNETIEVKIYPSDLCKLEAKDYNNFFKEEMQNFSCQQALIIHNAGQIGEMNKSTELGDRSLWRNYYDLNMFSVAILNSAFFKTLENFVKNFYVINVTSICGRLPFKDMSLYGSAKAARELFFRVLAEEENMAIILNYSPGPVQTAMFQDVIKTAHNAELRDMFVNMESVLTCEQTVGKLIAVVEQGDFKSGDTIDYFDRKI